MTLVIFDMNILPNMSRNVDGLCNYGDLVRSGSSSSQILKVVRVLPK